MSQFEPLSGTELTAWILESAERLAEIAATVGAQEPVPGCPPWTMRQLVSHVISGLSGWYPYNIAHGDRPTDLASAWVSQPELPRGNAERLRYLHHVAADFATLVDTIDLDAPCYVFQTQRIACGWVLRAATECAVHVQDAEAILGDPNPFTPERAATSIDETLRYMWHGALMFGRNSGADRVPDSAIGIRSTDLGLAWRVTPAPDDFIVDHLGLDDLLPELSVIGDHADLIQWLWGRSTSDRLQFHGDRSLIDAWNLSART
jgi:uncharacterized protein (TIGR03083 family)